MNDSTLVAKQTILIVDDIPANLSVITDALTACGYKTLVATTASVALERARRVHPDLILLDVVMPEMDGFEICRRLKSDAAAQDIPVIFMTVLESLQYKLRGFLEGAVDYVTKPIQQEELLARVSAHLRIRQQAADLARANAEIQTLNEQLRTENLRVSADLKESQQQYLTLVEEISDGYFVLQEGVIVFANSMFSQMHAYAPEEVVGRSFADFVAPESRPAVADLYRQARQEMLVSHLFEYWRMAQDGRTYCTELTAKSSWYNNQLVDIGICRDITARVEMEQKLREAERMAYIGSITTSLSHELRNPLSAVKMTLQILAMNQQLGLKDHRRVEVATNELARLEAILSELLDVAKPLHLVRRECQIPQLLNECLDLLRVKLEAKRLNVRQTIAPDLPPLYADAQRLIQVFINLLLNAFDASDQDGLIRISVRSQSADGQPGVAISIEDEGTGLPEGHEHELFEPFFTTKPQGTGLGLTNVKHLVEAHGGRVTAGRRVPHGACLRVWLPKGE